MSSTTKSESGPPHVALFPCAGMGHLIPFLRLATMLDSRGCTVTFITVHPTVSAAESDHLTNFFTIHQNIKRLEFQLIPYEKSQFTNEDPFFIQIETIGNSVHLLRPLLSSLSPTLSAIIADFPITTSITRLASDLSIPTYIVITTSARFFSLMSHLPHLVNGIGENNYIEIPSLGQMPLSSIPPPMLNPNHFFAANISSSISSLFKVRGVLINTFTSFEPEAIEALNMATHVPRVFPVGPLESLETGDATNLPWLDQQEPGSVLFVSFGSRTALVFLPSGIGNLTPFFRLAVMVASSNCKVTFVNIQPQASSPELTQFSRFISNYQAIKLLDFQIHSQTPSNSTIRDPFIIHIESINSSLYRLNPILSSLQVSAIFSDFVIAATMAQIAEDLNIPLYIISTTSALFFSTVAYLPVLIDEDPCTFSNSPGKIEIPGLTPVPKSSIPPTWMHDSPSNYLLAAYLLPNARSLSKVKGFLLNTYEWFEPETISALKDGRILNSLPPVFPVGPLQSYEPQKSHDFPWLNEQPAESVLYVNFGSREVLSTDQMRELGEGLEICGYKYLWVLKNEEKHDGGEFQELLTDSFLEGTEKKGKIIKGLVNHERVLAHPAIGGFVNQCEWDSIMLAAWYGVPMLTWPQHGDQKMNAETVELAGLGILVNDWGWGREKLVERKEIGWRIKQIMGDLNIKKKAKIVREKAREACETGGSSNKAFVKLLEMFCRRC